MSDFKFTAERESSVEDTVIAWAENNGWVARLMSYRGRRACADNFFFGYGGIYPIEFKRPGGEVSGNQEREHRRLAKVGVRIPIFERAEDAIAYLQSKMK
ncbi:hypothetical protein ACFQXB_11695 [Plastorhodobacter daqingensis]|uniref:VRR-NUC domain-containing protein n=1 Tax=Plastorhodobacter daqingensis TaxID=1387281 RepID=A0ABW2UJH9_9RHOB